MGIFSSAKKENELVLVFDIGSSSVSGALFLAQNSGIPKIIFSIVEPIKIEAQLNINNFLPLMLQALDSAVNKIYSAKLGAPDRCFCVLSSPWYTSQTRIISYKKNVSFTFNTKLADELIQKEIKIFEEENIEKYKDVGNAVRAIELKNIKTALNGYEISKPLNQKTKELEMVIFVAVSGENILQGIENIIAKHFNFHQIKFSSFAMASFSAVRDINNNKEDFLLADIAGEITDISMIKNNVLRESISFPIGRNFFIRGVASSLGCGLDEAKSLISLFKDEHAEKSVVQNIMPIMDKLKTEWLKKFQESLAHLSHDISVPSTIFIAVDKDLASFFNQTIKNEQFNQYSLTESKFEVIFLSTELLHGAAFFEDKVIRDPFIIMDSVYISRFLRNK
jgi:cell division ATPase FtsA